MKKTSEVPFADFLAYVAKKLAEEGFEPNDELLRALIKEKLLFVDAFFAGPAKKQLLGLIRGDVRIYGGANPLGRTGKR